MERLTSEDIRNAVRALRADTRRSMRLFGPRFEELLKKADRLGFLVCWADALPSERRIRVTFEVKTK